jgi:hypothetical protein
VESFWVVEIKCDNKFCPLKDLVAHEFDIYMNYVNPKEHVLQAEKTSD